MRELGFDYPSSFFVTPAQEWQVGHIPYVQGSSGGRSDLQLAHRLTCTFVQPAWARRIAPVMDSRLRGNDEG